MNSWFRFVFVPSILLFMFAACIEKQSNQAGSHAGITKVNFVDIASESVKFANVPATINTLNTALVFSASALDTAEQLSSGAMDDKAKMKAYLEEIQLETHGLDFKPGPIACPQGGVRDNQIVSLTPQTINMTVSLAGCRFNDKEANGFVQIKKLDIQGVPLASEVWTIAINLYFDMTLSDVNNITDPISLKGDANFTMTAARQLYSMSIGGDHLEVLFNEEKQTLLSYNLITANDSANGYFSLSVDADYLSSRHGQFHLRTDPHLIVNGGDRDCSGKMVISPPAESASPAELKILSDRDCLTLHLEYDADGDGVFDANTTTSWEYLSNL